MVDVDVTVDILGDLVLVFRENGIEIQNITKLELLVVLDQVTDLEIELVSIQGDLQHWRQAFKSNEFLGILLTMHLGLVLIVSFEFFDRNVLSDAILNGVIVFHT